MESRATFDLRRRFDTVQRQLQSETKDKEKLETQFKALLKAFTTQRKALELSIAKNKRFEESNQQLSSKNRDMASSEHSNALKIEALENENKAMN